MFSPPQPEISLVLVTCSRAALLTQALASLLPQFESFPLPTELILVDDGSTDTTPAVLAELQRTTRLPVRILSGERQGVAAARNLAATHAAGRWLASFDDDQIALPNWLQSLHETANMTGAAVVGGALALQLSPTHTLAALDPRTRSILGEHAPLDRAAPYPTSVRPATNNVLIRRHLFLQLEGYDTRFTEGAEDADFFDRVHAAGHALWFAPAARALHVIPESRLTPQSLRWTSLRIGAGDARLHHRRRPFLGPLRLIAARLAVALVRDLPQLHFASPPRRLDIQCSLWYTQGVLRSLPGILTARQTPFLQSLNFRNRNGERPAP